MRLAWDAFYFLRGEHDSDASEPWRCLGEEGVVKTAAAAEAMALLVEGEAGDKDAIEVCSRDERAADGIGFAQSHGAAGDDVVPAGDLVPFEFRLRAALNHERQHDAFALSPSLLDQRMNVRLEGERREEGDACAFAKCGMTGGGAADEKRGLGPDGGTDGAKVRAHFAAQDRFRVDIAHGKKRCNTFVHGASLREAGLEAGF